MFELEELKGMLAIGDISLDNKNERRHTEALIATPVRIGQNTHQMRMVVRVESRSS